MHLLVKATNCPSSSRSRLHSPTLRASPPLTLHIRPTNHTHPPHRPLNRRIRRQRLSHKIINIVVVVVVVIVRWLRSPRSRMPQPRRITNFALLHDPMIMERALQTLPRGRIRIFRRRRDRDRSRRAAPTTTIATPEETRACVAVGPVLECGGG